MSTQYLDVPGGRIAFDDTATDTTAGAQPGSGVPVVLLPGMLVPRSSYRGLRPLLRAAGHRVITVDLRGLGESSAVWDDYSPAAIADDTLALLDRLGIERAVLVGNSYTGATVVKLAGTAPERVAGIVLIDAFIENFPPNAVQRTMLKVFAAVLKRSARFWGFAQRLYYPSARPADFAEYRAELVAMLRERPAAVAGYLAGDSAPVGWSAAARCPALVLMGSKDLDFPKPAAVAERQAAALRGRMVMIDGAGHYPMAELPQVTADAMLPFLQEAA